MSNFRRKVKRRKIEEIFIPNVSNFPHLCLMGQVVGGCERREGGGEGVVEVGVGGCDGWGREWMKEGRMRIRMIIGHTRGRNEETGRREIVRKQIIVDISNVKK